MYVLLPWGRRGRILALELNFCVNWQKMLLISGSSMNVRGSYLSHQIPGQFDISPKSAAKRGQDFGDWCSRFYTFYAFRISLKVDGVECSSRLKTCLELDDEMDVVFWYKLLEFKMYHPLLASSVMASILQVFRVL